MPNGPIRRSAHHHGNLRTALLDAALAHVRAHGAPSFSLRDATTGARVTSAAAYRHFRSRADLLDEVVVLGFGELARSTQEHVAAASDGNRLLATGAAYVDFARADPHLFTLMFSPDGALGRERALAADLGVPGASEQLRNALDDHGPSTDDAFLRAWGLAHGLAALSAAGIASEDDVRRALTGFVTHLVEESGQACT